MRLRSNDKKRARLNVISDLLGEIEKPVPPKRPKPNGCVEQDYRCRHVVARDAS